MPLWEEGGWLVGIREPGIGAQQPRLDYVCHVV